MTRADNPEYFEHVCEVIKAVFVAEDMCEKKHNIKERVKSHDITPQQYVEYIADELVSKTDPNELNNEYSRY